MELASSHFRKRRWAPTAAEVAIRPSGSSESNVWHYGLPAAGPIRPSLPLCFGPAGGSFDRSYGGRKLAARGQKQVGSWQCRKASKWNEPLKLVSRQFRKQRLALWAAGPGPDRSFTAMVFWPCGRSFDQDESQLQEDASKLEAGSAGRQANGSFEASF